MTKAFLWLRGSTLVLSFMHTRLAVSRSLSSVVPALSVYQNLIKSLILTFFENHEKITKSCIFLLENKGKSLSFLCKLGICKNLGSRGHSHGTLFLLDSILVLFLGTRYTPMIQLTCKHD
jgi:hypothetical protein